MNDIIKSTNEKLQNEFPATAWGHVGSVAIFGCGKDDDYIVCVEADIDKFVYSLEKLGFELDGEESYDNPNFGSYKNGQHNIILTENREFFNNFLIAAALCRRLNLVNRRDRIILHEYIADDKEVDVSGFLIRK